MAPEAPQNPRSPGSTYRLQFNREFTFAQAVEAAEYLAELGISVCYASPLFQAAPQSEHGYNVCGFGQISCDLGRPEEFDLFTKKLHGLDLGLLLDVVPNHMAADPANPWWRDVIEKGPASAYAEYFDVDWGAEDGGKSFRKLLLPVLGDHYAKVLEHGDIKLSFRDDGFCIEYYDKILPVGACSYRELLKELLQTASADAEFVEHLKTGIADLEAEQIAGAKFDALKEQMQMWNKSFPAFRKALERVLAEYRGQSGKPSSFGKLHQLLQTQPYRLAYWRSVAEDLNYRRFFDITELVGLRVERPEVFEAVHELVFRLVKEGRVTGLRIDHPDGLRDPTQYFERLQEKGGNLYVVAEKILMPGEPLPQNWPIAGTTGYDFLNLLNGIYVNAMNREAFDRIYYAFTGCRKEFQTVAYESKKKVLLSSFQSELNVLTRRLKDLARKTRYGQDVMRSELRGALVEVISCFPVYRTYVQEQQNRQLEGLAERYVRQAVREAKARKVKVDAAAYELLEGFLLLRWPEDFGDREKSAGREFVMRFQQLTGPAMAKGMEDTTFYNYNRLLSLNEVGGNPGAFGVSLEQFHQTNEERLRKWPGSLLATATHDTKRGEDVRSRLNVLSEIPTEWEAAIVRWRELNASHKQMLNGREAPTANDEYLFYQTLVGAWPMRQHRASLDKVSPALCTSDEETRKFTERIQAYMVKALKESKANTSWTEPNADYEEAVKKFVHQVLAPAAASTFLREFLPFQRKVAFFGQLNSLAQLLLKSTCPGVPDIYQGTELWDLSLVDPDNRQPVDFALRRTMLADLKRRCTESPERVATLIKDLLNQNHTGQIKMFTAYRALQFRREHRELFENGNYVPLEASDAGYEHVCAFLRRWRNETAIVVSPRLVMGLTGGREVPPLGESVWKDSFLLLPGAQGGQKYTNIFTNETLVAGEQQGKRGLPLARIFKEFPVALLFSS